MWRELCVLATSEQVEEVEENVESGERGEIAAFCLHGCGDEMFACFLSLGRGERRGREEQMDGGRKAGGRREGRGGGQVSGSR